MVRKSIIASIEACPSGALTYGLEGEQRPNEPSLAVEIVVVDDGPYWLKAGIPVQTSEGVNLEVRNRVTLCRCGDSTNKPLCDGTHRASGFRDAWAAEEPGDGNR
jgi:CDGSH-type Zn-finger protein